MDGHNQRLWSKETPPRAWGRRRRRWRVDAGRGNTPTCVGKTVAMAETAMTTKKHPHVRGEDPAKRGKVAVSAETPPRAWGRLPIPATSSAPDRNTPTCVGKTPGTFSKLGFPWKHPHVRGEDRLHGDDTGHGMETPPRAWGRHVSERRPDLAGRNTPTCVGKTPASRSVLRWSWKHPHVRGEDPFCQIRHKSL